MYVSILRFFKSLCTLLFILSHKFLHHSLKKQVCFQFSLHDAFLMCFSGEYSLQSSPYRPDRDVKHHSLEDLLVHTLVYIHLSYICSPIFRGRGNEMLLWKVTLHCVSKFILTFYPNYVSIWVYNLCFLNSFTKFYWHLIKC